MRLAIAWSALMLTFTTVSAHSAFAQRFEGVITMRVNASAIQLGSAIAGAARGGAGRSGVRNAPSQAGRGGGRGDALGSRGADGRGGAPAEIEYMTRHGKVRISLGNLGGGTSPGAMIYDPAEGQIYTIFPAMSMYMQSTLDALMPPPDTTQAAMTRREAIMRAPVIVHTKKFELIAEHRCEHVLVTVAKQQTDVCMAKGLGTFVLPTGMGRAEAWQSVLTESNGFPLKVTGSDGRVAVEVTKVERKSLPESMFNVPESYTRMPDRPGPRP